VYELLVRPLSDADRERYWQESKRFAWLFGIRDAALPPTYAAFQSWMAAMLASDTIAVGTPAREMGKFLLSAPSPLHAPFTGYFRLAPAALLPPRLREAYGLRFGAADQALWSAS